MSTRAASRRSSSTSCWRSTWKFWSGSSAPDGRRSTTSIAFLGPVTFSLLEHPLPHDADAGAFEDRFHDAVVLAGFTAVAESQRLAEGSLLERPLVDRNPLVAEWVVRTSVRACDEAV